MVNNKPSQALCKQKFKLEKMQLEDGISIYLECDTRDLKLYFETYKVYYSGHKTSIQHPFEKLDVHGYSENSPSLASFFVSMPTYRRNFSHFLEIWDYTLLNENLIFCQIYDASNIDIFHTYFPVSSIFDKVLVSL